MDVDFEICLPSVHLSIFRSDNDVKNHFYNALRKGIRKICKVLRIPDCTRRVRQIKPKDLSTKIH